MRFFSIIPVGTLLVDDGSPCSISECISNLSCSTSSSNILLEISTITILDGGEPDTDGYFLFNLSENVLQDSLITVWATYISLAFSLL